MQDGDLYASDIGQANFVEPNVELFQRPVTSIGTSVDLSPLMIYVPNCLQKVVNQPHIFLPFPLFLRLVLQHPKLQLTASVVGYVKTILRAHSKI